MSRESGSSLWTALKWTVAVVLLSYLASIVANGQQNFLAPYGSYNQLFQFADGTTSVNQTVQLRLADTMSAGRLQIGEYVLGVQSMPPVLRYRSRAIGTIPKTTRLHQEEVCLVQSTTAREAAASELDNVKFDWKPSNQTNAAVDPLARRLFEWSQIQHVDSIQPVIYIEPSNHHWVQFFVDPYVNKMDTTTQERLISTVCGKQAWPRVEFAYNRFILNGLKRKDDPARDGYEPLRSEMLWSLSHWETQHDWFRRKGYMVPFAKDVQPPIDTVRKLILVMRGQFEYYKRRIYEGEYKAFQVAICFDYPGRCFTQEYQDRKGDPDSDKATCAAYAKSYKKAQLLDSVNFEAGDFGALSLGAFERYSAALNDSFAQQSTWNTKMDDWAGATSVQLQNITDALAAQQGINNLVHRLQSDQSDLNQLFVKTNGETQSQIKMLYETSKNSTDMLIDSMNSRYAALTAADDAAAKVTNQKFMMFGETMKGIMKTQTEQFEQLYRGVLEVGDSVQGVASILDSFIRQRQYNRLMVSRFYSSVDKLKDTSADETPLVSRDGIRPRELTGADLHAMLDSIDIVYAPTALSVKSVRINFYFDTISMLEMVRPWTTVEQMFTWMGTSNCQLRPSQNSTGKFCLFWAERNEATCASDYNWNTRQCRGVSTPKPTQLLLHLPALQEELRLHCAQSAREDRYLVSSAALSRETSILRNSSNCDATVQQRQIEMIQQKAETLMTIFSFLWMASAGPFQNSLKSLELKRYGRLPNGIKTEMLSLGYSPTTVDKFNAGDIIQCMRGYWLSVSRDTLQITSLIYDSTSDEQQQILVDIESEPNCLDDSCYKVSQKDLKVNYVVQDNNNGFALPSTMVVIGDISASQYTGVYDVPSAMIETTSNPLLRSNLLSYLLMPANVTQTMDFEFFNGISGGLFNAYVGSASADDFLYPAILDNFGYPLCNTASGLPLSASSIAQDNSCVAPFFHSGSPLYSSEFSVAPAVGNGDCTVRASTPGESTVFLLSQLNPGRNNFSAAATASVNQLMNAEYASPAGEGKHRFTITFWLTAKSQYFSNVPVLTFNYTGSNSWVGGIAFSGDIGLYISCSPAGMYLAICGHGPAYSGGPTGDQNMCAGAAANYFDFQQNKPVHFTVSVDGHGWTTYADGQVVHFADWIRTGIPGSPVISTTSALSLQSIQPVFSLRSTEFSAAAADSFVIRELAIHSHPLTTAAILALKTCQLPSVVPRCWLPPAAKVAVNQTTWDPPADSPLVDQSSSHLFVHKTRAACLSASSGRLISRSPFTDSLFPTDSIPPMPFDGSFTLMMWMPYNKLMPAGVTKSVLWDNSAIGLSLVYDRAADPVDGQVFILKHLFNNECREYSWSQSDFDIGTLEAGQVAEFVSFTFSSGTVSMHRNGIGSTSRTSGGCGPDSYEEYHATTPPEMIVYYPAAVPSYQLVNEMLCQLNTFSMSNGLHNALLPSVYSTPIAACVSESPSSTTGYCRHPMMCGGTCSAYAILDRQRFTFSPLQTVCDPGWLAPDCAVRCSNVDEFGACLQQTQQLGVTDVALAGMGDAYAPNGYWCQVLKHYQTSETILGGPGGSQMFVTFSARSYEYLTDITIPTGQIVSLVQQGACPTITMQSDGSGSLLMIFTNTNSEISTLRITTASESSCAAPLPCCANEYSLTIPSYRTISWTVPSTCAHLRTTVELNSGSRFKVCRTISSSTAAAEVSAAITAPLTANIQRSIVIAGNEVLTQLVENNQRLATTVMRLQSASIRALASGFDNSKAIDQLVEDILSMPPPSANASALAEIANPFNDDRKWKELLDKIRQLQEDAANKTASIKDGTLTLEGLNLQYAALVAGVQLANDNQRRAFEVLEAQTIITNKAHNNTIWAMKAANDQLAVDVAIAKEAAEAQMDAMWAGIRAAKSAAEAAAAAAAAAAKQSSGGGSGGSGISDVGMGFLVTGCVIGALAGLSQAVTALAPVAGPYLSKLFSGRPSGSSKKLNESETDSDEDSDDEEEEDGSQESEEEEDSFPQANTAAQVAAAVSRTQHYYKWQQ